MSIYETGDLSLESSPYSTLRGWAMHRLMPEFLGKPGWVDLRKLRPKAFESLMFDMAMRVDCDITPYFVEQNPEAMAWIAKCYRILFKCLVDDWRMTEVLLAEAELPTIILPDGRHIRCGTPDIFGVSETYEGGLTVELKTGIQRVKRHNSKLARYASGSRLLMQDMGLEAPFRGTMWVSFASTKQDALSGHYYWSERPTITPEFVPFSAEFVDAILERKYGIDMQHMACMPRTYADMPVLHAA